MAEQLLPAAQVAVQLADLRPDVRVLDLGCGTGNASLLAAQRGAQVTAIDPAPRLRSVAYERALAADVEIDVLEGEASSVPLPDDSIDVLISVFAIIFCPDAHAAAAEASRVLASAGRLVLTAWLPDRGPIGEKSKATQAMMMTALGAAPAPPGTAWHDPETVASLFGPHGFEITASDHELFYEAPSAEAWFDRSQEHPMTVRGMAMLDRAGRSEVKAAIRERSIDILERGNLDADGFRIADRYRVLVGHR